VRCPIAFEWRVVFGEGDTLKRSDTAAVTWLLNLCPGARQSIAAQSWWPINGAGPLQPAMGRDTYQAERSEHERGQSAIGEENRIVMWPIKLVSSRFIHPARRPKTAPGNPRNIPERRHRETTRGDGAIRNSNLIARTNTRERTKKSVDLQSTRPAARPARPAAIAPQRAF